MGALEARIYDRCKARRRRCSSHYVEEEQRSRCYESGLPLWGWTILGYACVIRRRHSYDYASSSFLVSLHNHLSQCAHYLVKGQPAPRRLDLK